MAKKILTLYVIMTIISDTSLLHCWTPTGRKPVGKGTLGSPRWKRENRINIS
jgi:hypothetical protein